MTGRVIWPPRRARPRDTALSALRRRPDVRAQAHLLLDRWRHRGDEQADLAVMLGNAVELAALRALLASLS